MLSIPHSWEAMKGDGNGIFGRKHYSFRAKKNIHFSRRKKESIFEEESMTMDYPWIVFGLILLEGQVPGIIPRIILLWPASLAVSLTRVLYLLLAPINKVGRGQEKKKLNEWMETNVAVDSFHTGIFLSIFESRISCLERKKCFCTDCTFIGH